MPRQITLLIFIFIILYLFWIDRKNNKDVSFAALIPFCWIAIGLSRLVSYWLNIGSSQQEIMDYAALEGNPIDRLVFTFLIISGIIILSRRKLDWGSIFKDNAWIWLYFVYGAISLIWSEYPFIVFKRIFKSLGTVIMILVILSETRPYFTFGVILKRVAFIWIPISVLFVKFYPELGRAYSLVGGTMYTGVGLQKNSLGLLCLITGVYFSWNLLYESRSTQNSPGQRLHYSIYIIILPMIVWLLYMCNSVTAQICLILAIGIFLLGRLPIIINNPKRLFTICILGIATFILLEFAFDVKEKIIAFFGRRPDLTDRVYIWQEYFKLVINPIFGYGFESFYSSALSKDAERRLYMAHNGYLEMYLNLGVIGVLFVACWIFSGLRKVYYQIQSKYSESMLRFVLIVIAVVFSWTESSFAGNSIMWLSLLFAAMTAPNIRKVEYNKIYDPSNC